MLLCKKCDVYVGFDGANVAKIPEDVPREKLNDICWICRRTRVEVLADPYGRSTEVTNYVDKAMFEAEPIEERAMKAPRAYLLSATPDPLGAVAAMMMMYEGRVIRDLQVITTTSASTTSRSASRPHSTRRWKPSTSTS
jgi:hypothetical protein